MDMMDSGHTCKKWDGTIFIWLVICILHFAIGEEWGISHLSFEIRSKIDDVLLSMELGVEKYVLVPFKFKKILILILF